MTAHVGLAGRLRISLRLTAMLALLIGCVAFYHVYSLGRLFGRAHNPWPRIFLGGIARIAGVDVRTVGTPGGPGLLLLANHASWIDIPALAGATGSTFVAHDGLAAFPFLRWLCRMNDTVFVARHDRASVAGQVAQVREAIREAGALTIFPEGTTSDSTSVLPFKSSLLSALDPLPGGVAAQPVLLDYGAQAAEIAWVGSEPGLANFLKVLARAEPVTLTIHFLPPLSGEALATRKTIAAAARSALVARLEQLQRVAL